MGAASVLERILEEKQEEVARQKRLIPQRYLEARIREDASLRPFAEALRGEHVAVIAEVKQASPSKGLLVRSFDPAAIAAQYEEGGAAAVSVLTDTPFFLGHLEHLPQVRTVTTRPVLRKDFIIDVYQVYESRAWRADALLLIVAALEQSQLEELMAATRELGMDALVEVHTAAELERALAAGARVIGINNRDLRTFETRLETTEALAPHVPEDVVLVSESGIAHAGDVQRLARCGIDGVLVGEHLMRHPQPAALLKELAAVPRQRGRGEQAP